MVRSKMRHLPLFASLSDRACLVVGGGAVAARRTTLLLEAGARVTVLAPSFTQPLEALAAAEPRLTLDRDVFADRSVEAYWLVVAATDDRLVNAQVAAAADRAQRFCNVVDAPDLCSFIMPAIVDRDPVTIAISSAGESPVVSRWIKGLVETLVPSRIGALARLAGAWRERTRAALPDPDERRHFWQEVVAGRVAEHCYAGRDLKAAEALKGELEAWQRGARGESPMPRAVAAQGNASHGGGAESLAESDTESAGKRGRQRGEAYLVGAGPGHPDLITLRGRQLLASADVVLYDRLGAPELLRYARRDAELISVGKRPHQPSTTQAEINRLLVEFVAAGKRVCRLKGGDPMIFGRAGEEIEALVEAGLYFQVVPGVSAVQGCAAYAGIPLTLRKESRALLISTGHADDDGDDDLAAFRPGQTLALYMGVAQYDAISARLIRAGHDAGTPVAVVENGTTETQRVIRTTLGLLPQARVALEIRPPALLLIGATARFAERYAWYGPSRLEVFDDSGRGGHAHVSLGSSH